MVLYTRIIRYFPLSHVKMLALYTSSNQAFRWKTRYIVHITEQLQNFDYFRRLQALLYPILLTYIFFPLYFSTISFTPYFFPLDLISNPYKRVILAQETQSADSYTHIIVVA